MRYTCALAACLAGCLMSPVLKASDSYHIGNSLTNDSIHRKGTGFTGLEPLLAEVGITHEVGYHISGGKSLKTHWDNPNSVQFSDPNYWPTALQSEWDILTLQPHYNFGGTLGNDRQHISDFIGYAAGTPDIFVLQTWPEQAFWPDPNDPNLNYSAYWESSVVDAPSTTTTKNRAYFDLLMEDVRADNPDRTIWMVPTGEVLYELDQQIIAGTLPDVASLDEFYRDHIHMDLSVGVYVATVTMASTMLQVDPRDFSPPSGWFDIGNMEFTPELLDAIHETIYSVITTSQWSGYADFNRDGDITGSDFLAWQRGESTNPLSAEDLAIWEAQYGPPQSLEFEYADFDQDGEITGLDFLAWQRGESPNSHSDADLVAWENSYGLSLSSNLAIVPEPASFCYLAFGSLIFLRRTRGQS